MKSKIWTVLLAIAPLAACGASSEGGTAKKADAPAAQITASDDAANHFFGGRLNAGQRLLRGGVLRSADGRFKLILQSDNNVVLYEGGSALWATNTATSEIGDINARYVIMQGDGNFVLYSWDGSARWASNTGGNPGAYLALQNDGNLVVYSSGGTALWNSGTYGH